ncbi:hypothetical protein GGR53DRAFT_41799 [Hypoxylon sp. FL1150]|nr:hypothetical protein GGR53DRAFT_41799 [Hypoxylon sp. FL1150]
MALLSLSLVLASIVYAIVWKPPFVQTLIALLRGHPRIQQSPTTARPSPPESRVEEDRASHTTDDNGASSSSSPAPPSQKAANQAAMPPPSIAPPRAARNGSASSQARSTPSPQTTPKATASAPMNGSIPLFSINPDPPASAAAVARTVGAETSPSALPTLSAPSPPPQPPLAPASPSLSAARAAPMSMAPPPRPPAPNAIKNAGGSGTSLLGVPSRGPVPARRQSQHSYDRQPGTSTLAPPPSHSSKPAKPSRKVILEPGRSPLDWARLANSPTSDLRNLGRGAPYLRVTPSMLKRQTGRKGKDAWTALGGRVYNITPYLPFHPGGEPELLRAAGRDGSKLFGEIHPWVNYENMLANSMIGILVDEHEAKGKDEMDGMD